MTGVQTCALPISKPKRLFQRSSPFTEEEKKIVEQCDHVWEHGFVEGKNMLGKPCLWFVHYCKKCGTSEGHSHAENLSPKKQEEPKKEEPKEEELSEYTQGLLEGQIMMARPDNGLWDELKWMAGLLGARWRRHWAPKCYPAKRV